jgi:glycosyltransferase involved in cell wall biosynthesis
MVKAADALTEAGYHVRVVSTRYQDWAWEADQDLRQTRLWDWRVVNYDRHDAIRRYIQSGITFRAAKSAAKTLGPSRCPFNWTAAAYGRAHKHIFDAIAEEPSDFIYGGTCGALAATALAASRLRVPYALDLEDFHSAQHACHAEGQLFNRLADTIERAILPGAAFVTAGSAAIARAYRDKQGLNVIPLNNTFPLPQSEPDFRPSCGKGLSLYWFGQTIGAGRGLETVVDAMGRAKVAGELHLRGKAVPEYVRELQLLAAQTAPNLSILVHEPAPPDVMVDLCKAYDAGLATEPGCNTNNDLALSNKALTYVLAGVPVLITDTPGQHAFARDLGEGAIVFKPGDSDALAAGLKRWSEDKSVLARAKAAAWDAAKRRWHWEHQDERGALLRAVAGVFQS